MDITIPSCTHAHICRAQAAAAPAEPVDASHAACPSRCCCAQHRLQRRLIREGAHLEQQRHGGAQRLQVRARQAGRHLFRQAALEMSCLGVLHMCALRVCMQRAACPAHVASSSVVQLQCIQRKLTTAATGAPASLSSHVQCWLSDDSVVPQSLAPLLLPGLCHMADLHQFGSEQVTAAISYACQTTCPLLRLSCASSLTCTSAAVSAATCCASAYSAPWPLPTFGQDRLASITLAPAGQEVYAMSCRRLVYDSHVIKRPCTVLLHILQQGGRHAKHNRLARYPGNRLFAQRNSG